MSPSFQSAMWLSEKPVKRKTSSPPPPNRRSFPPPPSIVSFPPSRVPTISGKAVHMIAVATGDASDRIEGMVFRLSDAELESTDSYETNAYVRIEARLESGRRAWVYVAA